MNRLRSRIRDMLAIIRGMASGDIHAGRLPAGHAVISGIVSSIFGVVSQPYWSQTPAAIQVQAQNSIRVQDTGLIVENWSLLPSYK